MRPTSWHTVFFAALMGLGIGFHTPAATAAHQVPGDFARITDALAAASPGDTIMVAAGTYSPSSNGEVFPLNLNTDSVYLFGAGMGESIIDAEEDSSVLVVDGAPGSRISGFTITGGLASQGGGIWVKPDTPVEIDHNLIQGNRARLQGAAVAVDADAWVHHNVVWGNVDADTSDTRDPHGMVSRGSSNALFEHNLVGRSDGNGLIVHDPSAPTVRHNIFYQNGRSTPNRQGRGICWFSSNPLVVYHNLFFDNEVAALLVPDLGGNMSGEDANDLLPDDDIYGNIDADPLLADPDSGDFHLTWGSPAIDAGDSTLPYDPDGTVADIGPFYFDQTSAGIHSYRAPAEGALSVLSTPVDPAVRLRFALSEPVEVLLAVYDIRGRRVGVLAGARFGTGEFTVSWDRTNDAGHRVGPGVYFAHLKAGDLRATRKLVLAK
jgi:serine protease